MTKILLYFTSKNYKSLKNFLIFLNINLLKRVKLQKKIKHNKTKKSFFSILKSPHVNKKAQDQFNYIKYSKSIFIHTNRYNRLLFLIKRLCFNLFSDVRTKIKIVINKNYNKQIRLKIFNPSNFKLNFYNKN